jgi:predicted glycosyltransferase involved in capsule biosynthesis
MLRSGTDFVYPYDGRFARVPRSERKTITKHLDVGMLKSKYTGMNKGDMVSVGGAIAYNKKSFINAGGENENFISYGAEDLERFYRFKTLGYEVERVNGALYHLDHAITIDSSNKHNDFEGNKKEYT